MTWLIGALLLAGWACWAAWHLAVFCRRCPPLARLAGQRAAIAAAERRLAYRLETRQIDPAAYRRAMDELAGRRPTATGRT
ncbi:hypothetical protein SMIR_41455 (plasmid) [Streptomyces mirabilis]|uniref:hypothetical protein n=1 Tax=Streptomyces mirabilis TaxID=68239 RepID=UPI001BAEA609|nr:hypothetical protein [Streptomyces mirabilis]QUW85534.1 hypothetical protein SMIR_41455 [Streptomyces mirabilis]